MAEEPTTPKSSTSRKQQSSPAQAAAEDKNDPERTANKAGASTANADSDAADPPSDQAAAESSPATKDNNHVNKDMANNTGTVGDGTPTDAGKKKEKRKSTGGVPEHKKKLNRKKSMPAIQRDVKPGQLFWARLKGYPPWPAVICDEGMLPEVLLNNRPVTAARPDGSYRPDFEEGGKNVMGRTYPVMYLHTNEFGWILNTDLAPLDVDELKTASPEKKTRDLWKAYEIAMSNPDLQYFKNILDEHDKATQADKVADEERRTKKAKKDAKTKRKSKDAGADEDVDMEDVDDEAKENEGGKKAKASKKRKKEVDSDGEQAKPAKTPKTKLKMTGPKTPKTPNGESAAKAKAKPKAKKVKEQTPKQEEKPMTEEERLDKKRQNVMFLRHKLQKGFLTRDKEPKPEEMKEMAEMFDKLDTYTELEVSIIRATKINKVLKGILKLPFIPNDDEFNIKKRSADLLGIWNKALANDIEDAPADGEKGAPVTNGAKEEKVEEAKKDVAETKEVLDAAKEDVNDAATTKEDAQKDIGEKADEELPDKKVEDDGDSPMQEVEGKASEAQAEGEQYVQGEDVETESAQDEAPAEESDAA